MRWMNIFSVAKNMTVISCGEDALPNLIIATTAEDAVSAISTEYAGLVIKHGVEELRKDCIVNIVYSDLLDVMREVDAINETFLHVTAKQLALLGTCVTQDAYIKLYTFTDPNGKLRMGLLLHTKQGAAVLLGEQVTQEEVDKKTGGPLVYNGVRYDGKQTLGEIDASWVEQTEQDSDWEGDDGTAQPVAEDDDDWDA